MAGHQQRSFLSATGKAARQSIQEQLKGSDWGGIWGRLDRQGCLAHELAGWSRAALAGDDTTYYTA